MKRWITVIALALVLGLAAGTAEAAKGDKKAAKGAGKGGKGVAGSVVRVDGTNLVVSTRGKQAAEVTIATDASTEVEINGAKGTLGDLKSGMRVQATPNTGTAKKITAGAAGGAKGDKAARKAKKAAK